MATDKTTKGYTKNVSLKQIFDGSLQNPHFKPKSFKPTQKTMMAHALEFAKWLEDKYYWNGVVWKNAVNYNAKRCRQ